MTKDSSEALERKITDAETHMLSTSVDKAILESKDAIELPLELGEKILEIVNQVDDVILEIKTMEGSMRAINGQALSALEGLSEFEDDEDLKEILEDLASIEDTTSPYLLITD